jgi:hypothetical protein
LFFVLFVVGPLVPAVASAATTVACDKTASGSAHAAKAGGGAMGGAPGRVGGGGGGLPTLTIDAATHPQLAENWAARAQGRARSRCSQQRVRARFLRNHSGAEGLRPGDSFVVRVIKVGES